MDRSASVLSVGDSAPAKIRVFLMIERGNGAEPIRRTLRAGDNLVGRAAPDRKLEGVSHFIPLESEAGAISRSHASIQIDGSGHAWVQDNGSMNGTSIQRDTIGTGLVLRKGAVYQLFDGDRVIFGDVLATYHRSVITTRKTSRSQSNAAAADDQPHQEMPVAAASSVINGDHVAPNSSVFVDESSPRAAQVAPLPQESNMGPSHSATGNSADPQRGERTPSIPASRKSAASSAKPYLDSDDDDDEQSEEEEKQPVKRKRKETRVSVVEKPSSSAKWSPEGPEASPRNSVRKSASVASVASTASGRASIAYKPKRVVACFSSLDSKEKAALNTQLQRMGGSVVDDIDDEDVHGVVCNLVVVKGTPAVRTPKVIMAVAAGIPVVTAAFIRAGDEDGIPLDRVGEFVPAVEANSGRAVTSKMVQNAIGARQSNSRALEGQSFSTAGLQAATKKLAEQIIVWSGGKLVRKKDVPRGTTKLTTDGLQQLYEDIVKGVA